MNTQAAIVGVRVDAARGHEAWSIASLQPLPTLLARHLAPLFWLFESHGVSLWFGVAHDDTEPA